MRKINTPKRLSAILMLPLLLMSIAINGQNYVITNSNLDVGNPGGMRTVSDNSSLVSTDNIQPYNNGSSSTNLWSDPYALPFSYSFYGTPVTHLMVSKNGLISFDTTLTGQTLPAALDTNTSLPNSNLPDLTIAYFWDDFNTLSSNDNVYAFVEGTAPNRQFWVFNFSYAMSGSSYNYFAAVFEEGTNKFYVVDMNYCANSSNIDATVGAQLNNSTAVEVSLPLNGTQGSPNIEMGSGGSGATDNEYYEFTFLAAGACVPPQNLSSSNITSSGADISWTAGTGTGTVVEYGAPGYTPGSGTSTYVVGTSTTITSMMSNSTYDVYVKDSCATNSSLWVGPISFTTLCASQTIGIVSINPALPASATNFQSFNALASELSICGISGPVMVNVKEGTYNERVVFDSIPGISSVNTVTIQSDPTNTNPVEITDSSTTSSDNYVIQFNNTDWITLDGITVTGKGSSYSTAIEFMGTSSNITVQNCILSARDVSTTSTNHTVIYDNTGAANKSSNISILGNEIMHGSYGVYLYGVSSTNFEMGHLVSDNNIHDFYYYGVRAYYQDGIEISGNEIISSVASSYTTVYGVYNYYSDNSTISENKIAVYGTSTNYGIYNYYCDATALAPNKIVNNMISCIGNTGTTYGIYPYNNYYTDIYYNSINVTAGSSTAGRALYLNSSSSGTYGNINVQNNCIVNTGGGYAAEISSNAVTLGYVISSDYNNIYGTGSTLVRAGTTNFSDLASYQVGAMVDANSVSVDPLFTAAEDLHVAAPGIDGFATPIASITTDIDGDARGLMPDIGADEFTAPNCLPVTDLTVVSIYADSAVVSWKANGGSSYNIEYDTTGFTQGSGMTVSGIVDTFYTITGVMPAGMYDFYIQNNCGGNGLSPFAGPETFTTNCSLDTIPYMEDFSSGVWPVCWTRSNDIDVTLETTCGARNNVIEFNYEEEALSPVIDASGAQSIQVGYYLSAGACTNDPEDNEHFHVSYWDGTQWVLAKDYDGTWPQAFVWDSFIVPQSALTSSFQVKFDMIDGTTDAWHIDSVVIDEGPSCAPPISLGSTNITSTTADIYWTTGGASNWMIQYDTTGFTPGTGNYMAASNDTTTISGLMPNTTYDVYVKDSCSATSTSPWTGPITFTTACVPFVAPFTENFDGLALTSPYTDLPNCWDPQVGPDYWDVTNNSTNSPQYLSPSLTGDHTTGSGQYMWIDASSDITGNEMLTALVDFSGLNNPEAGFWFASNNTNNNVNHTIALDAWDGTQWVNIVSERGNFSDWVEVKAGIPSGIPTTTQFRIYAIPDTGTTSSTYYFNDLGVDDFFVKESPTCSAPTMLGAMNITTTSAEVYWTTGGANDWNIQYGATGFALGSGMMMNATNDTVSLTSLTAATTYDVYVRDSCGVGNVSSWVGPYTFSTLCATFTAPFTEDFEASTGNSSCWSQEYVSGTKDWSFATGSTGGAVTGAYSGTMNARFTSSSGGPHVTKLISPVIDASTLTGTELTFAYAQEDWFGDQNSLVVYYRDSANGAWNWVWSDSTNVPAWDSASVIIPSTSATLQIAFEGVDEYGRGNVVDDVEVKQAPGCPPSSNLGVASLTTTSALVYWTSVSGATTFAVEYGPSGFTPCFGGASTTITVNNDTALITGLAPNTMYDFYVIDSCSATSSSGCPGAGPVTFNTLCNTLVAPFMEDFEVSTGTYNCWTQEYVSGTKDWTIDTGSTGGAISTAYSGSLNARFTSSSGGPHTTKFISPVIDASTLNSPELSFAYGQEDWAGDQNFLNVYYRDSANGAWNYVWSDSTNQATWTTAMVAIPSTSSTLQLAFEGVDNYGRGNVVDDVMLEDPLVCNDPDSLMAMAYCDSAVVTWQSDTGVTSTLQYGPQGFTPGSGTFIFSASSGTTINNLMMGTAYDVWVIDTCSNGNASAWVGPTTFTTDTLPKFTATANVVNVTLNMATTDFDIVGGGASGTTYSWDFGDGNSGTGASTSHNYTANNTYTVVVTATNDCGSTQFTFTVDITGIGMDEVSFENVNLYPNPNDGLFTLKGAHESAGEVVVEVISMTGVVVHKSNWNAGDTQTLELDLRGISPGIYQIRLTNESGVAVRPFVVKN